MALIALLAMCISLFVGTVLIGHIPLAFKFSQAKIQDLSTYGGGLLLGAALGIVIPEGIEALYDAAPEGVEHGSTWVALALLIGFLTMYMIDELQSHAHVHVKPAPRDVDLEDKADSKAHFRKRSGAYTLPRRISTYNAPSCSPSVQGNNVNPIDRSSARPSTDRRHTDIPNNDSDLDLSSSHEEDTLIVHDHRPSMNRKPSSSAQSIHEGSGTKSISTTIGLIAHSLADGISLGASSSAALSSSSGVSLDVVVFLAIIIHKAPAAFGLTSVLLGDGWSRTKIRQALIMFAMAAPLGAVAVYFILKAVAHLGGHGRTEESNLKWWTGFALLVSGGTFLFVAAQVTQEQNPTIQEEEETPSRKWKRVALTMLGMLSPMGLRLIAGHGH